MRERLPLKESGEREADENQAEYLYKYIHDYTREKKKRDGIKRHTNIIVLNDGSVDK